MGDIGQKYHSDTKCYRCVNDWCDIIIRIYHTLWGNDLILKMKITKLSISMAKCKTVVTSLLMHWRYQSLTLSHQYIGQVTKVCLSCYLFCCQMIAKSGNKTGPSFRDSSYIYINIPSGMDVQHSIMMEFYVNLFRITGFVYGAMSRQQNTSTISLLCVSLICNQLVDWSRY